MNIAIASDHAGYKLKTLILDASNSNGHTVADLGPNSDESVDYPDFAKLIASHLKNSPQELGVLICGSGQGIAMAANRYPHLRAALCRDVEDAKLARQHNNANVLVLGAKNTSKEDAMKIMTAFTESKFEGGRHEKRVAKLGGFFSANIQNADPDLYESIDKEMQRQQHNIELIASENIVSQAVLDTQGSILTNKYAEGYPGRRYYGGCEFVDIAEKLAIERLKELYNVKFANVQPHSGSQANQAVFLSLLTPGDTILGMSLDAGGHLTHGSKVNQSGKWFNAFHYGVSEETGMIDMEEVSRLAHEHKPKLMIAGGSAYPRIIDFAAFRKIADEVGAYFLVDMAHFSGLVAGGVFPSPIEHAHVVTSTTHKTLRGPRGGMILTNDEVIAKKINSAIFPGLQGGPLMHVIAAKAVAYGEALKPEFKQYAQNVIDNCQMLSKSLEERGYKIFTGGTDCHLLLVDLRPQKITGKDAEETMDRAGLTCNKNSIPFDTEKPMITSGIRLGTAAGTTRGFCEQEFKQIANLIADVLDGLAKNGADGNDVIEMKVREEVIALCDKFPIY